MSPKTRPVLMKLLQLAGVWCSRLSWPIGTVAAVSVFMAAVCHYRLHTTYKTHI